MIERTVVPECIHGLEAELCDVCTPKAVVVPPTKSRVVAAALPRSRPTRGASPSRRAVAERRQQRLYHITHIRNLEGIVNDGALRADAVPRVSVSSEVNRELRRTAAVPSMRSESAIPAVVSDFVPFYLSAQAHLWHQLRDGAHDSTRWSPLARTTAAADFIFLVTTLAAVSDGTGITDSDAAHSLSHVAVGDDRKRMLDHLHDSDRLDFAEALVPDAVDFGAIQLIGVANDRVRDEVKNFTSVRVAVYPPWFQSE